MTRCRALVPEALVKSPLDGWGCDDSEGHEAGHISHRPGLSWRESDEAGLTITWSAIEATEKGDKTQ